MRYETHAFSGMFLSSVFMLITGDMHLGGILVAAFASLVPDLDHEKSWLSRRLKPLSWIITSLCEHRTYTHTIFGLSLFSIIFFIITIWFLPGVYVIYFAIGYASHLITDSMTVSKIMPFYPEDKTKYGWGKIKTGSGKENLVMAIVVIGFIITMFFYNICLTQAIF